MVQTGKINPDNAKENIPNPNPNYSPLIVNSAVRVFKYPKIMNSKNPSTDNAKIILKYKFFVIKP